MFKKVLVNEDQQIMNFGIQKVLDKLNVSLIESTQHCGEAFDKIRNAYLADDGFNVLITDLLFNNSSPHDAIKNGMDLVRSIRARHIPLQIIVLSIERNPLRIKKLIQNYKVNAYIIKGTEDEEECEKALQHLTQNQTEPYLSPGTQKILKNENVLSLTQFDLTVIKLLTLGYKQKEIPEYLKVHHFKKSSLRSVEQRLEVLRTTFAVSTNYQLISTLKDMDLI